MHLDVGVEKRQHVGGKRRRVDQGSAPDEVGFAFAEGKADQFVERILRGAQDDDFVQPRRAVVDRLPNRGAVGCDQGAPAAAQTGREARPGGPREEE